MSPSWPPEALKAQAVVARTFALANLGKYHASGFDLSDDSLSQGYGDLDRESAPATEAVRSTRGQVLWWGGSLLPAFFHSCCGGHTLSSAEAWGGGTSAPKPLRGVGDRWCRESPHAAWTAYFSDEDLLSALQRHGVLAASLHGIRLGRRTGSGHLRDLRLALDDEVRDVRADDLRKWLGSGELKSTKIARVIKKKHGYVFLGRGFGHGVGLCQWGAKSMAEHGKTYRQILKAYFPGADLHVRDD